MEENIDPPRIVTELEIFENIFLTQWRTCLKLAITELNEIRKTHGKEWTIGELLQATAQLFICWNQKSDKIYHIKIKRQEAIDKKFGKQQIKEV